MGGDVVGNFGIDMIGQERPWSDDHLAQIQVIGRLVASAFLHWQQKAEIEQRSRFEELKATPATNLSRILPA